MSLVGSCAEVLCGAAPLFAAAIFFLPARARAMLNGAASASITQPPPHHPRPRARQLLGLASVRVTTAKAYGHASRKARAWSLAARIASSLPPSPTPLPPPFQPISSLLTQQTRAFRERYTQFLPAGYWLLWIVGGSGAQRSCSRCHVRRSCFPSAAAWLP